MGHRLQSSENTDRLDPRASWVTPRLAGIAARRPSSMRTHPARPLCLGLCALAVAFVGVAPTAAMADPPSTPSLTYGTDGTVEALARLGNTIYLGGVFSNVGLSTGGG